MSSSPKKRSRSVSRLHRISAYLPNIMIQSDSKQSKEKPPPLPQQHNLPVRQPSPSPSRDAPPVPPLPKTPPPSPPTTALPNPPTKLQKIQPPTNTNSWPLLNSADEPETPINAPAQRRARHGSSSNVNSLAPPSPFTPGSGHRVVSSPASSRPTSYTSDGENSGKVSKRRSFFQVKTKSRASSDSGKDGSAAWVIAGDQKIDYNISLVTNGEKVPELWEEYCDTFVHLFPDTTSRGPSFKVPSLVLSSSAPLYGLLVSSTSKRQNVPSGFDGSRSPSQTGTPPETPIEHSGGSDGTLDSTVSFPETAKDIHLYFPTDLSTDDSTKLTAQDTQKLVDVRNFFAFMTGQPLVATSSCPTIYYIFLAIAGLLQKFEFTNHDGSTYGEAASASFSFFCDEYHLADVRASREKTIEALILGERMRSTELYHEAFEISKNTQNRLERASLDLSQRHRSVDVRLTDFDFPALFSGAAASNTSAESKVARFKNWRTHYLAMRRHILSYYKIVYGQWPPKSKSKNSFVEGGLNRQVLKQLYTDMCNLYDFMADREAITTRTMDSEDQDATHAHPVHLAARKILSEFDRSSPPVLPPIPFDVPKVPTMATVEPGFPMLSPKDQHKASSRKLKEYELLLILAKSKNLDVDKKTPFMEMYKQFEERESKGKNVQELVDQRYGHWLMIYAVLQSLPMLVIDVENLRYSEGVEYFLCEPPLGNLPWMEDAAGVKMAWYGVQGGQGVVNLPSDIVQYGVEGVYRRSHCWSIAEKWISRAEANDPIPEPLDAEDDSMSPLAPPPGFGTEFGRPNSRGRDSRRSSVASGGLLGVDNRSSSRQSQRKSVMLGLEMLPIPSNVEHGWRTDSPSSPGSAMGRQTASPFRGSISGTDSRPTSSAGRRESTFDDILGNSGLGQKKKK
ncbi:choriogenin hminor protein [Rutstroemia sp. NJR-2017a BBW]|nr:choriogenin hminor protein [Rutstroemia sp. NJR-2017a BBW]